MSLLSATAALLPPREFTTRRLQARAPRAEDAPAVFAVYAGDANATRYLAWRPYTAIEPLAEFLRDRSLAWEKGDGHYPYLLNVQGDPRPIGSIGVFVEEPKVMFGYVLGQQYWGRGYAAEALRALVEWAMAEPRVQRAWAYCAVENVSSARVMTKAGLLCEGVLPRWQVFPNLGPEPRDCVFYAKSKPGTASSLP